MQCLSLEYTSHLFLSKRKQDFWTKTALKQILNPRQCRACTVRGARVKVMTFDLLWSSLARRHRLWRPRLHPGRVRAGAGSFLFCHERAPSSRSGGRRSVSDEVRAPEDVRTVTMGSAVTMITMWGFSSDWHRDNGRYTGQNMGHDTSNWRQSSVDFLFIYFEDNQSCVNHKKLLTRILPFWSSQCPRHLALSTESAGRTLGRFTSFRGDAFESFLKYLFCGCLFTCLQSLYLNILQMLQF